MRSLQLIDEGGHDEFSAEPLLRCTHQLWQEFAARGIRDWAGKQPARLPDLRPPSLPGLDETLARLGVQEPLPGPDPRARKPVQLAVQLIKDPAPWITVLEPQNLALAGRAALACRALDAQHWTDCPGPAGPEPRPGHRPAAAHRGRPGAGRARRPALRRERQGPHGRYLWPRHWVTRVPAGRYRIGDEHAPYDDEKPETEVELQAFEMAFAPVTNAEYLCFVEAGGYRDEQWEGDTARRWLKEGVRNEAEISGGGPDFAKSAEIRSMDRGEARLTAATVERVRGLAHQTEAEHESLLDRWYGARRFDCRNGATTSTRHAAGRRVPSMIARWLQAQSGRPVRLPARRSGRPRPAAPRAAAGLGRAAARALADRRRPRRA